MEALNTTSSHAKGMSLNIIQLLIDQNTLVERLVLTQPNPGRYPTFPSHLGAMQQAPHNRISKGTNHETTSQVYE